MKSFVENLFESDTKVIKLIQILTLKEFNTGRPPIYLVLQINVILKLTILYAIS